MLAFTKSNIEESKQAEQEFKLGELEDPEIQKMIYLWIQNENQFKKKSKFKMKDEDFPSLVSETTQKEILWEKSFQASEWKQNHKNFLKSLDIFDKQVLKDIKKIFPLLSDEVISFAYYQLND